MTPATPSPRLLGTRPIPVQAKLAAAWTSFMFLYVYVDYLHLYKPGIITDILNGVVFTFDISAAFFATALALSAIPNLIIALSVTLPSRHNRTTNLVVATLLIPYMAFNVAGAGSWLLFYAVGLTIELLLLAFIMRTAWTWPHVAETAGPRLGDHAATASNATSGGPTQ